MMEQDFDTAIELFSFASALDTDDPRAMLYIGDCHLACGRAKAARLAYRTAVQWAGDQEEFKAEKIRAMTMEATAAAVVEDEEEEQ